MDNCVFETYKNSATPHSKHILNTVYLETTHGLDSKTPKFSRHVIYIRYCLDEEDPYMQIFSVCAILDYL